LEEQKGSTFTTTAAAGSEILLPNYRLCHNSEYKNPNSHRWDDFKSQKRCDAERLNLSKLCDYFTYRKVLTLKYSKLSRRMYLFVLCSSQNKEHNVEWQVRRKHS
jgi:hypothetical protein